MNIFVLEKTVFFFFCYSFIGWFGESIYKSMKFQKITNTGFLKGPLTPIFGIGAIMMLVLEHYFKFIFPEWERILIYTGMAVLLEYYTSVLFEKIYYKKLWDYSDKLFNINGRICLQFSVYWLLLSFLVINFIHPLISNFTLHIMHEIKIIDFVLISLLILDVFYSFKIYHAFMKTIKINFSNIINMIQPIFSIINIPVINNLNLMINKNNNELTITEKSYSSINEITKYNTPSIKNNINQNDNLNINKEYYELTKDILEHYKFNDLKLYKHHDLSIYNHVKSISLLSYKICKFFNLDYRSAARGALLHDFFFYDWRKEKPIINKKKKLHAFYHPRLALINAEKYFNLNNLEKDIILKHMWPLTIISPKYIESFIVSFIDKIISAKELFIDFL